MKKILLISDVHKNIDLMKKILNENLDVDYKIYLGDFEVSLKEQNEYKKLFDWTVLGNRDIDTGDNLIKIIEINGLKIMLVHGHVFQTLQEAINFKELFNYAKNKNVKLILHGHDHIRAMEEKNGILRFNPGSITIPLDGKSPSYSIMKIDDFGKFEINWVEL